MKKALQILNTQDNIYINSVLEELHNKVQKNKFHNILYKQILKIIL